MEAVVHSTKYQMKHRSLTRAEGFSNHCIAQTVTYLPTKERKKLTLKQFDQLKPTFIFVASNEVSVQKRENATKNETHEYFQGWMFERGSFGGQRVFENQDDGVASEEHLADVAVLVHGLRLLLAWKNRENIIGINLLDC